MFQTCFSHQNLSIVQYVNAFRYLGGQWLYQHRLAPRSVLSFQAFCAQAVCQHSICLPSTCVAARAFILLSKEQCVEAPVMIELCNVLFATCVLRSVCLVCRNVRSASGHTGTDTVRVTGRKF